MAENGKEEMTDDRRRATLRVANNTLQTGDAAESAALPGLASLCSAHPWVLRAAFAQARAGRAPVLIESTCNQVNQFGGYTGMTPPDFVRYVTDLAAASDFPAARLILGGDHLGPSVWQDEPAGRAMPKACDLVRAYVRAGYSKIHLDASMKLADDPPGALPLELSAARAAALAQAAESAADPASGVLPCYVIGTEVPIPGGAQAHETGVAVTRVEDVRATLDATRQAFARAGLHAAWQRVIAVVVQPGVEYGDDFVLPYQPPAARPLAQFIEDEPQWVYEAHSTDYQSPQALRQLVRDHFAILKVGPALTFAWREALFALALMENELFSGSTAAPSHLLDVLEAVMLDAPAHWQKHYRGSPSEQRLARRYSFSDRVRYYWPDPRLQTAQDHLLANLSAAPLPLSLLSQYAPDAYRRIRQGELPNTPHAVLLDRVASVLRDYAFACASD